MKNPGLVIACVAIMAIIVFIQVAKARRRPYTRFSKDNKPAVDPLQFMTHRLLCERGTHEFDDHCACVVCGTVEHTPGKDCRCMDCGAEVHEYHNGRCLKCGKCAHTWYKCKCILCGEIRDGRHEWDANGVCAVCGAIREEGE